MLENKILNLDYGTQGELDHNVYIVRRELQFDSRIDSDCAEEFTFRFKTKEYTCKDGEIFLDGEVISDYQRYEICEELNELRFYLSASMNWEGDEKYGVISNPEAVCDMAFEWLFNEFPDQGFNIRSLQWVTFEVAAWEINDSFVLAVKYEPCVSEMNIGDIELDDLRMHDENKFVYVTDSFGGKFVLLYARKEYVKNYIFDEMYNILTKRDESLKTKNNNEKVDGESI